EKYKEKEITVPMQRTGSFEVTLVDANRNPLDEISSWKNDQLNFGNQWVQNLYGNERALDDFLDRAEKNSYRAAKFLDSWQSELENGTLRIRDHPPGTLRFALRLKSGEFLVKEGDRESSGQPATGNSWPFRGEIRSGETNRETWVVVPASED
ncbi:MAG: hypothetical protein AAGF67_05105, partial [Verrucomicrobiota bacterium]